MRYLAILAALILLSGPVAAYAETFTWDAADDAGPPKGIVGHDGILCQGQASYAGHTVRLTNYVGYSAGQPEASERAWQQAECRSMMRSHIALVYLWKWGITLPADAPIEIRTRPL